MHTSEDKIPSSRVFLSYSHADAGFAGRIETDLSANGIGVWRDIKQIKAGDSITRSIEGALSNCNALLLVLSLRSVASAWVEREYRAALHLQSADPQSRPRIIPCILDACDIPLFLRDVLYADFRQYESGFLSVARSLAIDTPHIPSVRLREDVKMLLSRVETAIIALRQTRYPSPSHDLFDIWSPVEDELLRLRSVEFSLGSTKHLDRCEWEIERLTDDKGRPFLDNEAYPRNLFIFRLAIVIQAVVQLAARYGNRSDISQDFDTLFWWLGGTPASN